MSLSYVENRLLALEERAAHQERTLVELNEVVTRHWREIDRLERLVRQLREEIAALAPPRDGAEPPPPHY